MSGRPQVIVTSATGTDYYEPRSSYVWVAHSSTWNRPHDPIYHRVGDMVQRERTREGVRTRRGWDVETTCGATVSAASWFDGPGAYETSDYSNADYGLRLPLRWASQFARPCRRCWP